MTHPKGHSNLNHDEMKRNSNFEPSDKKSDLILFRLTPLTAELAPFSDLRRRSWGLFI